MRAVTIRNVRISEDFGSIHPSLKVLTQTLKPSSTQRVAARLNRLRENAGFEKKAALSG
jgi:hypothetical protein